MAIETRIVRGLLTEIYINGGGNFITQAAPTNFHCFLQRKVLSADESVEEYMEVTPAQKDAIEAAEKKWVAPSEELIAEAEAAGAVYNRDSGYFELNGLTDITEAQMRVILQTTQRPPFNVFVSIAQRNIVRTNLWHASPQSTHDVTISSKGVFSGWLMVEVINLDNSSSGPFATKINGLDTFKACMKLHTILGEFSFVNNTTSLETFRNCYELRTFKLYGLKYDVDLQWSPLLSLESITFMLENAANTTAITITLHADAYARLTDDLIAKAAQRQITFAST